MTTVFSAIEEARQKRAQWDAEDHESALDAYAAILERDTPAEFDGNDLLELMPQLNISEAHIKQDTRALRELRAARELAPDLERRLTEWQAAKLATKRAEKALEDAREAERLAYGAHVAASRAMGRKQNLPSGSRGLFFRIDGEVLFRTETPEFRQRQGLTDSAPEAEKPTEPKAAESKPKAAKKPKPKPEPAVIDGPGSLGG